VVRQRPRGKSFFCFFFFHKHCVPQWRNQAFTFAYNYSMMISRSRNIARPSRNVFCMIFLKLTIVLHEFYTLPLYVLRIYSQITDRNPKIVNYSNTSITSDKESLETSTTTLELQAIQNLFSRGKLILACEATQFSLYRKRVTQALTDDIPQPASVLSPARSCSYPIGT
jgi:hypothetical protein